MNRGWRWRLALAWHRHQVRHYAWAAEVAICDNDPAAVGAALAAYDREERIVADLSLAAL